MASFSDQLIRLATHQPAKGRTMSARKEFSHLVRSMPLRWVQAGQGGGCRREAARCAIAASSRVSFLGLGSLASTRLATAWWW